ncbi:MAG: NUDIX hydrolase [Muribaculaceae bacterium]|nr:NUDIX hydrolase [Muribaculaceae bacterium]
MKIKKWETIESQYLIERPWLTARKDIVKLPNGNINPEFYILEYPDWVNVLAITKDGKFLMIEQYRHGLQDVFVELVAGVIEKGEEPLNAAKRELLEETGYGNGNWELLTVISQNPSTTTNLTYCFIAKDVEKVSSQNLDATEDITPCLLTEKEVLDLLMTDKMKQSLMAAPLWKYFYLNKK